MRTIFFLLLFTAPLFADAPIPTSQSAQKCTVPPGFQVTLFAGEPDVVQPIAFTFDAKGRMWVVENFSYPGWADQNNVGKDRIIILEDTNGDGKFDRKKIFYDKAANTSAIEVGHGGVWLGSTPNLVFIPDRDGDDKPDGPAEIKLDGFSTKSVHNVQSALVWGPDGWLWGCHGILATASLGKPGTPEKQRVQLNCGVFRYHPQTEKVEAVMHGTTNPWGLDFNDEGDAFITNCVIKHLWHAIPGSHVERMFGSDLNPYTFQLLPSIADHIHWGGGDWTSSRGGLGSHGQAGGGHAHSGAMVYLADQFPKEYRGRVFMCNIHGNRVNQDILERNGSSYTGKHAADFFNANDPWFRGIAVKQGPDGSMFVADWSDTGECHNYVEVDRRNGRLYKITYGGSKPWTLGDLRAKRDIELVALIESKDEFLSRQSRLILQERFVEKKLEPATLSTIVQRFKEARTVHAQLRFLWTAQLLNGFDVQVRELALQHSSEAVRSWAVLIAYQNDGKEFPNRLARMLELLKSETSLAVFTAFTSALQFAPIADVFAIATVLDANPSLTKDVYLPNLVWYRTQRLGTEDKKLAWQFALKAQLPIVRQNLMRQLVMLGGINEGLEANWPAIQKLPEGAQIDLLNGLTLGLQGRNEVITVSAVQESLKSWFDSKNATLSQAAMNLGVSASIPSAFDRLLAIAADEFVTMEARTKAIEALAAKPRSGDASRIVKLLDLPKVRSATIKALAAYPGQPEIAAKLTLMYQRLTAPEKTDAMITLTSRELYSRILLDAIESKSIPKDDLSTAQARQIISLNSVKLNQRLGEVWGEVRQADQNLKERIKQTRAWLTTLEIQKADLKQGKKLYQQSCGACHQLFDGGGNLGPNLTGSQRGVLEYLLENVYDPSAVVAKEYLVHVFTLKSGRTINGVVRQETDKTWTIQTLNETLTISKADVEDHQVTKKSIMPDGLFDMYSRDQIRDLIGYVQGSKQVE
jgi:putative membrane-bound dehydrogenase-like protein